MRRLIISTLYLLTIFIPLTFTTINSELFEFPKFVILLSGTLIILIAWLTHIIAQRDYQITRSGTPRLFQYLNYSVLAVLATQALATIFSINPYTSFWGYYSRFHGGLLTTICYTIVYFAALKWLDIKSTQKLLKITVVTSIFVSVYGVAEHFGIDKQLWIQDVQNRVFSTLGQPNWLAAYLVPNALILIYFAQIKKWPRSFSLVSFGIIFATLLFTRSRSGLLAFVISIFIYLGLTLRTHTYAEIKKWFSPFVLVTLILLAILGSAYTQPLTTYFSRQTPSTSTPTPQGTSLETGGTESGDIRKIVWTGALKLIAKHPLLGTGPETFGYTYYWERPLAHNLTSEWDFIYNKAHNEYLNLAAGAGLIGLLSYLSWHVAMFTISWLKLPKSKSVKNFRRDELQSYLPVVSASVIAFTITNFFGFSVIPVYLLMILISACAVTLNQDELPESPLGLEIYPLVTILCVVAMYLPIKIWFADYYYKLGKAYGEAGQLGSATSNLEKSVKLRPKLDLFHSALGESYANIASAGFSSTDEGVKAQSQKYLVLAVKEAELTKAENPYHLNYFKSRAKIYLSLATIDGSFNSRAALELEEARGLAKTDPKLAYNLGLVYTRLNQLDKAETQLKDAIALKPNYPDPYYALTLLYEQSKQTSKIKPILESAKSNLATYSAQLREKITTYTQ